MNKEINEVKVSSRSTLGRLGLAASLSVLMVMSAPALANHKAKSMDNQTASVKANANSIKGTQEAIIDEDTSCDPAIEICAGTGGLL